MTKETCVLCGTKTSNYRSAFRALRGIRVEKDGFVPRERFSYEEIKKLPEGTFASVCADRRECINRQRTEIYV